MKLNPQTKKLVPSEKDTRKQIRAYLKALGVAFWHNMGGALSYRGLPDLEGVHRGKHFYIEIKSPIGKLSKHQENFKEMVEREGETVIVAHSFEEFEETWERFIG